MTNLLLYLLPLFVLSPASCKDADTTSTVYVIRYATRVPDSGKLLKMFPDDSIFYHKGYAIEKPMGYKDLNIDGVLSRTEEVSKYYFIDFARNRFFEVDSLPQIRKIGKPGWTAIANKQLGIRMGFAYYNGEKCQVTDTIVNGAQFRIVRYKSATMMKGKEVGMTVLMQSLKDGPMLFSDIETRFEGRVRMINAAYPDNQGDGVITIDAVKIARNNIKFNIIDNVINQHAF